MPKINPDIIKWARETAGFTLEEAVRRLKLKEARGISAIDRLSALETGEHEPTRAMILKMVKQYHRPLLTFYMSTPPIRGNRGQDFRTLPDGSFESGEALLDALIRDVQARQEMVRVILEDEEDVEPLPFIGSVKRSDGVLQIVASIRDTLQLDLDDLRSQQSASDAFGFLRDKVEEAGIFVLLIGNLGSHHTSIDLEIFRGFAISDDLAPFVIINDQDSHSAWSFTLLHELAHLWLGQTGVSGAKAEISVERFCNDVAGELLLPREELANLKISEEAEFETIQNAITNFARVRKVSSSMVAYKLFRERIIGHATWEELSGSFRQMWINSRANKRQSNSSRGGGGPNYYVVRRHRVGSTLINFIGRMMMSGLITTSKAGKVLGVKSCNVQKLIGDRTI